MGRLIHKPESRRAFIRQSVISGTSILLIPGLIRCSNASDYGLSIKPSKIIGLRKIQGESYIENAAWYAGDQINDGFEYTFKPGTLADKKYIMADMLASGNTLITFNMELHEGAGGRVFKFVFGVLNECALRIRLPLNLVDQNTWRIPREGAFLKPMCYGDRVDLKNVDRIKLYINRKSNQTSTFCLTDLVVTIGDVPVLMHPLLPKGKLIDEIGQSTLHNWPGKTGSLDEMKQKLSKRFKEAKHEFPATFSKWGGCRSKKIDNGSGFFRIHKDDSRWWLIDPDGYIFWSAGIDCVRVDTNANLNLLADAVAFLPEKNGEFSDIYKDRKGEMQINYLAANYIRTFGKEGWRDKWATISLDELKRLRFNTVGNWSEWNYAAQSGFPYVRPMSFNGKLTRKIYRDFPDVFHADFEEDAQNYAYSLSETVNDPALIGYFMMNEPTWAFSKELPAVGMLYNTETCVTRKKLVEFLKGKYTSDQEIRNNWRQKVSFEMIETGKWQGEFTDEALEDLELFSEIMVDKYFGSLSAACRKIDPNHLNLGIRYAGVPPKWAVSGMKSFDVFSMNSYTEKVPFEQTEEINRLLNLPVMIGEWHFGALDVGLPASGIGHVRTQDDRGKAYRVYFEDAAANPYCVGVHWFTLYDQSALGRYDGENYNIGFLDVCNRPHKALCDAAIKSHETVYEIAEGKTPPFNIAPEYLDKLFL